MTFEDGRKFFEVSWQNFMNVLVRISWSKFDERTMSHLISDSFI